MADETNHPAHRPPWVDRWTSVFDLPPDWADPVLIQYRDFVASLSDVVYPDAFIGSDVSEIEPDLDQFTAAIDTGTVDFITCTRFFVTYHETLQSHLPSTEEDIRTLYDTLLQDESPIVQNASVSDFTAFCQGTRQQRELREYVDQLEKTFCYVNTEPPQPGDYWLVSPPEMAELVLTVEILREVEPTVPASLRSVADPSQRVVVRGIDHPDTAASGPTPAIGDHLTLQPLSFNYGSKLSGHDDR